MNVRVYTKTWHILSLVPILEELNINYKIFTKYNVEFEKNYTTSIHDDKPFDLGVSYGYSRKILPPLLTYPKLGFINFHSAPLPEYPGGDPYSVGLDKKVRRWGVTCHYMTEEYDQGQIIAKQYFDVNPANRIELVRAAYLELLKLFKQVMARFANGS